MLSEVPEGWVIEEIGNVLSVLKNGFSCKQTKTHLDGYVPVSRIETISGGYINAKKVGFVPYEEKLNDFRILKGDILFSHINSIEHVGKIAFSDSDQSIFHAMNLLLMRPNAEKVHPIYLAEVLRWDITRGYYREHSKRAVNQVSLNQKNISAYEFALPPLTEQKRIAEVLSSVDESIQATQRLIKQAERVKQGLMEDLLTGGLGSEAIERGEVPEGWIAKSLDAICTMYAGGTPNRKKPDYYAPAEIAWIKSGELAQGVITAADECISQKGLKESSAKLIPKDTPVVAMYGATAGKVGWLGVEACSNQAVLACIPKNNSDGWFLFYALTYASRALISRQQGGAQPNLSKSLIKSYVLPFPPLNEQKCIAEVLSSVDDRVKRHKDELEELSRLKKGLMDDLLTGKVRTV